MAANKKSLVNSAPSSKPTKTKSDKLPTGVPAASSMKTTHINHRVG